ncbi:hypothetical protein ACOBQX_26255 [Actinokineospora sp. G85]|uniref:hypothetical protein n=1 Tax=Actinokineospora sp. G85 TaxID=3406626 RepID=UPI003C710BD6
MASTESTPWVNWEAYTHDELYRMLWEGADVADVSAVAAEWGRHRDSLATHAQMLREQRTALADDWRGGAAGEAAVRLDVLAARLDALAEFARAGQRAAQDAADGLAMARAMMPPPAPGHGSAWTDFASAFGKPLFGGPGPAEVGTAFGAVAGGGFSFYLGAVASDQHKAQAVHAMRTYESSLVGGDRLIEDARHAIPAADSAVTTPAAAVAVAEPDVRVRWERSPSGGPPPVAGTGHGGFGGGAVGGGGDGPGAPPGKQSVPGPAPGLGARFGVAPGAPGHATPTAPPAEPAASRAAGQVGMASPPGAGRGPGAGDERHENRLPALDQKLFVVDTPTSVPVIGADR